MARKRGCGVHLGIAALSAAPRRSDVVGRELRHLADRIDNDSGTRNRPMTIALAIVGSAQQFMPPSPEDFRKSNRRIHPPRKFTQWSYVGTSGAACPYAIFQLPCGRMITPMCCFAEKLDRNYGI